MAGLAAGINAGLSQGLQLGMQVQGLKRQQDLDAQAAEDRKFTRGLQQQTADLQQKQFGLQEQKFGYDMEKSEREASEKRGLGEIKIADERLKNQTTLLKNLRQSGKTDDDPEVQHALGQVNALYRRKTDLEDGLYRDTAQREFSFAKNTLKELEEGKRDIKDFAPKELHKAFSIAVGRDISKIAKPEFASVIDGFDTSLEDALQSNNPESWKATLNYFNQMAEGDIGIGVGKLAADGTGFIAGQRISRIVPHPNDPEFVLVDLENDVAHPDGTRSTYRAPMTRNRRADDDELKPVRVSDLLEYAGRVGEMHQLLQDPEIKQKLTQAEAEGASSEFSAADQALRFFGYDQMELENGKTELRQRGDREDMVRLRDGKVLWSAKIGAKPSGAFSSRGSSSPWASIQQIKAMVANEELSPEEGQQYIDEILSNKVAGTKQSSGIDPTFANAGKVKLLNGQAISESDLADRYKTKYLDRDGEPRNRGQAVPEFDVWRDQQVQEPFRSTYRPPAEAAPGQSAAAPQGGLQQPKLPETIARPPQGGPKAGDVMKGYRFKGGNPADKNNWEKV